MVLAVRAAGFLFVAAQLAAGKLGSVTFASRLVPLAETGVLPPPRPARGGVLRLPAAGVGLEALWPVARRGAMAAFAWSGAVWFSVVYLGQHYVTDVIAGIVFAVGTWLVMTKILVPRVPSLRRRPIQAPALSAPDSGNPDMAAPAAREETAVPRGSG